MSIARAIIGRRSLPASKSLCSISNCSSLSARCDLNRQVSVAGVCTPGWLWGNNSTAPRSVVSRTRRNSAFMTAANAPDLQEALNVAKAAAEAAGAVIIDTFNAPKSVEHKGKVDLVTETDKACETLIFEHLRTAYPAHSFIGEEGSAAQGFTSELMDAPTWIVDPVDGTTNFVHRQPFVCVCIGLAVHSEVVVGVVYNPILKEMFTAVKGQGAQLNGASISVSQETVLGSALIASEVGVTRDAETVEAVLDRIRRVAAATRSIRASGSCALNLCSVAMGRLDAFYEIGFGGPWDVAAASLILTEAGGKVGDPAGGPFRLHARRVLGANAHLLQPIADILKSAKTSAAEPPPLP